VDEPSPSVRMELALHLAKFDQDPRVADAFRKHAEHLEVIAADYRYFLRVPDVIDEQTLIRALKQYGGHGMANAFRQSGRPALVKAAADEESALAVSPKMIEVR